MTSDQSPSEVTVISGPLTARLSTIGASLASLSVPGSDGQAENVVRVGEPYAGSICGRFANRIGRARITVDGVEYALGANEGPNHLHGGNVGFDARIWEAEPFEAAGKSGVRFSLTSEDGDEGYPGHLSVTASYWLADGHTLGIDFEATTTAATVVNLTNHTYWNLGGPGAVDITDHRLQLNAGRYLEIDEGLIPTGDMVAVEKTRFDFTTGRRLDDEYDHCFVLENPGRSTAAAVLSDESSGRVMTIETDQPALQLYTANHAGHFGVALEAQGFPDAPNHQHFPSSVLRPGDIYRRFIRHRFSTH